MNFIKLQNLKYIYYGLLVGIAGNLGFILIYDLRFNKGMNQINNMKDIIYKRPPIISLEKEKEYNLTDFLINSYYEEVWNIILTILDNL